MGAESVTLNGLVHWSDAAADQRLRKCAMKAIVLCADVGLWLPSLTFSTAQHLVPAANTPVPYFGGKALAAVEAWAIGVMDVAGAAL